MPDMNAAQTASLEENFAALEEKIKKLEQENLPLEQAFTLYSEGMALLKTCNEQIDRVEKQVLKVDDNGDVTGELPPF